MKNLIPNKKLKWITYIAGLLLLVCNIGYAQPEKNSTPIIFEGHILSQDSLPVENAFVINYRTSKIVTTDKDGYFKTSLLPGDSLMINHLNLTPTVIHADTSNIETHNYYISTKTYQLNTIHSTQERTMQAKYAKDNLKKISIQAKNPTFDEIKSRSGNDNSYNDATYNPGIHVVSVPLRKLKFQSKKKKKEKQKEKELEKDD